MSCMSRRLQVGTGTTAAARIAPERRIPSPAPDPPFLPPLPTPSHSSLTPFPAPLPTQAWGHSTALGPFAEVLATTEHSPATVFAELDYAQLDERRAAMPLRQQKRHDLYLLLDKTA